MTARASRSDLRQIRLDAGAIRRLPEQVQQAAEILAAYVAGLDQGHREAGRAARPGAGWPRQIPPTDPADVPRRGPARPADARQEMEDRSAGQLAAEQAAVEAGDVENSICAILSEIDVPDDDAQPGGQPGSPEIVLVWGADSYRRLSDLLR